MARSCLAARTDFDFGDGTMVPFVNVTRVTAEDGSSRVEISVRDVHGSQTCASFTEEGWADFKKQVSEAK